MPAKHNETETETEREREEKKLRTLRLKLALLKSVRVSKPAAHFQAAPMESLGTRLLTFPPPA